MSSQLLSSRASGQSSNVAVLSGLIHPLAPDVFKAEYWDRRPLALVGRDREHYKALLTLPDLDEILVNSSTTSSVRLVKDGRQIPLRSITEGIDVNRAAGHLEAVYQEYRNGCTIVLPFLHERWPPLRRLTQSLALELSASVQVNVYLTPPDASGLGTHYDTHDVFVLQAHGSKHWQIYDAPVLRPLIDDPYVTDRSLDPGEPIKEVILNSGDCLYIPRGYLHKAVSVESTSMHLTIGIKPLTWASVLLNAMRSVIDQKPELREALIPGFATDDSLRKRAEERLSEALASLLGEVDPHSAIDDAKTEALLAMEPLLAGHLIDLDRARSLHLTTLVRRRADTFWVLERDPDAESIVLAFNGKRLSMPVRLEAPLNFITSAEQFAAEELPGQLDAESRLLLVRRLLTEGFLTLSR